MNASPSFSIRYSPSPRERCRSSPPSCAKETDGSRLPSNNTDNNILCPIIFRLSYLQRPCSGRSFQHLLHRPARPSVGYHPVRYLYRARIRPQHLRHQPTVHAIYRSGTQIRSGRSIPRSLRTTAQITRAPPAAAFAANVRIRSRQRPEISDSSRTSTR